MKKTLYLMRHGETVFNVRKKIQGWCDSPLTSKGIWQAQEASKYYDTVQLDHAYCSTSERSSDTLEIVTHHKMDYTRLKNLREMNFGEFEAQDETLNPKSRKDYNTFFVPYGGESVTQVKNRMVATLTKIMQKPDHQNVLAVSHAGACVNFLQAREDPEKVLNQRFTNCGILKFSFDEEKFTLEEVIQSTK
ncbi:histidine phosphatase family protein [Pediococcus ethanolidurans]|uniref:histidine phosphatase family protein n=1 Tax=Pediococcus ethanolidurans TaxID=319653 RepID=UPI0021E8FEFB|nr:histidine phosphatase family protein [Pediococcus ethanolidurans]MCV3323812.1 histidine phosphatase family protein [Pediococcus ethanolidurans]